MSVDLTEMVAARSNPATLASALRAGWQGDRTAIEAAQSIAVSVMGEYGLSGGPQRLLSDPETQHKLGLAVVPSYGLTLHHNLMRSKLSDTTIDACPSAGDCVRVCVLNNNFGRFDAVKNAWRWRTDLLAHYPIGFTVLLGRALRAARRSHPDTGILFRPNINSDVVWERVVPALVDGSVLEGVSLYGYTKHALHMMSYEDGWVTPHYHVAYSWSERSNPADVQAFLDRGGNVAICTDRLGGGGTTKRPIRQWADGSILGLRAPVVDADLGDEWMLHNRGVIGDLSFKPRTIELARMARTSDFVVNAYDLQSTLFEETP